MTGIPTRQQAPAAEDVPPVDRGCAAAAESAFPPGQLLPDRQPAFMASWIYVFGVLTLVSLAWVIVPAASSPSWARPGGTCRPPATS